MAGVEAAGVDLRDVALFSHGTTVATNALITRRFPRVAMVTTRGFRDVIEIRRGTKDDLWDAYKDVAPPYVRRRDRFEVTERIDYAGRVVEPARRGRGAPGGRGAAARAASRPSPSASSTPTPTRTNERRMHDDPRGGAARASSSRPRATCCRRSSSTSASRPPSPTPCCRRWSAATCSGSASGWRRAATRGDLLLLHSGGGVMTPRTVERLAVRLAASGIAAGAIACRHVAQLCGFENSIGLDMGGTSTDISLVYGGRVAHHEGVVRRVRLPDLLPVASRC